MKNKIISIVVIVGIIAVIVGIAIFKNSQKEETNVVVDNKTQQTTNADFALNITSAINMEKLKSYNLPIVIDFGAHECIPCKAMEPVLKNLNKELQGKAIIKFVDVWKYPRLANGYPIELIPTQIFINSDGSPYKPQNAEELGIEIIEDNEGNHLFTRHTGAVTEEQMKTMLEEMGMNE